MAEIQKVNIENTRDVEFDVTTIQSVHTSTGEVKSIIEFIELLDAALEEQQRRDGIPKDKQMTVKWHYAKEMIEAPGKGRNLVVPHIVSRKFWNTSPDRERRPRKPMERSVETHPDDPNLRIIDSRLAYETVVGFKVMSPDAGQMQKNASYFEDLMEGWTFYFRDMGVKDLFFIERLEDKIDNKLPVELYYATYNYMVYTEKIYQTLYKVYDQINIDMGVGQIKATPSTTPETTTYSIDRE